MSAAARRGPRHEGRNPALASPSRLSPPTAKNPPRLCARVQREETCRATNTSLRARRRAPKNFTTSQRAAVVAEGSLVGQGDRKEPSASGTSCKTGRRVRKRPIQDLQALAETSPPRSRSRGTLTTTPIRRGVPPTRWATSSPTKRSGATDEAQAGTTLDREPECSYRFLRTRCSRCLSTAQQARPATPTSAIF